MVISGLFWGPMGSRMCGMAFLVVDEDLDKKLGPPERHLNTAAIIIVLHFIKYEVMAQHHKPGYILQVEKRCHTIELKGDGWQTFK